MVRTLRPGDRIRCFMITLNNPTDAEKTSLRRLGADNFIRYLVGQLERGETGTLHLQLYAELTRARSLRQIKQIPGLERAHIERRRANSATAAIAYVTKEDTRVTGPTAWAIDYGQRARATKFERNLKAPIKKILEGASLDDIREENPVAWAAEKDKIIQFKLDNDGGRSDYCQLYIYYGEPGTGKSYTARNFLDEDGNPMTYYSAPWPTGGRWWWPGYTGQDVLILDEFRHQLKYDTLLSLLDRYEFNAEAKGTSFQLSSSTKVIIMTTNIHPQDWYPGKSRHDKAPLKRRLNESGTLLEFLEPEDRSPGNFVMRRIPMDSWQFPMDAVVQNVQ